MGPSLNLASRTRICVLVAAVCLAFAPRAGSTSRAPALAAADLADLSLEQLANIVVTSVSRRDEPLSSAAASVYVITADDIRRSGAKSLPEVLRLAPNLDVARANSSQYAISARGFTNTIANRLLVLIDGRVVYSPLFSGVFWDAQMVMLEDLDRIEVISGPGATLWGSNAVNGVINIVTKAARDTQGVLVAGGAGNREWGAAARYGGAIGDGGRYRVYARHVDLDATRLESGASARDAAVRSQAGFRADFGSAARGFTVQGDAYRMDIQQPIGGSRDLAGANLMARWSRLRPDGTGLWLQAYYDRVEREQPGAIRETIDIVDVELQHGFIPAEGHRLAWGAGLRHANDRIENIAPAALAFLPPNRKLTWANLFVQDEWRLRPDLALTLGVRAEHNDYTGLEWLPNARLAWTLTPQRLLWTALSRSVRAPSRLDRDLFLPGTPPFTLAGGPAFRSEITKTAELGYRAQESTALSYSLTLFHHRHSDLRSLEPGVVGTTLSNRLEGTTSGAEAWMRARPLPHWRLDAGWVELRQRLRAEAGSAATVASSGLGNDPRRWVTLRSAFDLTPRHELDVMARYVATRPNPVVPSFTVVDARLGWRVTRELELSLVLQNILDADHAQFGVAGIRSEVPRSAFVKVLWRP